MPTQPLLTPHQRLQLAAKLRKRSNSDRSMSPAERKEARRVASGLEAYNLALAKRSQK